MIGLAAAAWAGEARFDRLQDEDGWLDLGTRRSRFGPVAVASRDIDGLTCYRAAVDAPVGVDALVRVTSRMARSSAWSSADLPVSIELERDGDSFVFFQVFDVPDWTFAADRYWVLRGTVERSGDHAVYRYHRTDGAAWPAVQQALAGYPNAVEPTTNFGAWTFRPEGVATRVEYRGCSAFGGSIPASLQSWLGLQQLPTLVEDLVGAAQAGRPDE